VFFFEKKNQKTFASWRTRPTPNWAASAKEQEFFGSFFQKRTRLFLSARARWAEAHPTATLLGNVAAMRGFGRVLQAVILI
jgi:hypothetical protein